MCYLNNDDTGAANQNPATGCYDDIKVAIYGDVWLRDLLRSNYAAAMSIIHSRR